MSAVAHEDRAPRDAGMSLAELVIAMGLLVLLGTIATMTGIAVTRSAASTQVGLENSTQSEQGMRAVSRVLRAAVLPEHLESQVCVSCEKRAIVSASPTRVVFYANTRAAGTDVARLSRVVIEAVEVPSGSGRYRLDQTTVTSRGKGTERDFCEGSGTSDPTGVCVSRTRTLAHGLVLPTSRALFGYYDFENKPLGSSLSAAQSRGISSIDVVLTVQTRPGEPRLAGAVRTAVQRIRLPNAEFNLDPNGDA